MSIKPFLIAPLNSGLQNDVEPWLLPEDAFSMLEDAYVWRGRIRKRYGYEFLGLTPLNSQLRVNIGTTDAVTGNFNATVPGTVFAIGQKFSIGTTVFTVNATGTPATLLTTGTATGTFNTTNGALVITGGNENPLEDVYFYPSTPVMGLPLREQANINFELTIAFDQQFAYQRSGGAWERLELETGAGDAIWTGDDANFFWTTNYRGTNIYDTFLYTVNNVPADGIRYLNTSDTWTKLSPVINASGDELETCLIIIGFKDRLVCFNTFENGQRHKNRARFSQNGDPTAPSNGWLEDTPGRGGYIDAYTQEAIITVELIKDRLIVYFEASTWELVYTGNETVPFNWQQLNSELGVESTHSIIGFDQGAVGVGNVGIHTCNGVNVTRIDEKIPDEVFKFHNGNSGPERVYGIRDFYREIVIWTFPDATGDPTYPTRMLLWNYRNDTWALFNDSFTCFGYFQKDSDLKWSDLGDIYGSWEEWGGTWGGAPAQSAFPSIVAGNQEGYVFVLNADKSANEQSLYITDMTSGNQLTIINHNLSVNDYILVEDAEGVTSLNDTIFQVISIEDSDNITLDNTPFSGTYEGNGYVTRVSNVNVTSKQWNPGTPGGKQFLIPYIDFLIDRTENGEVSLNYFIDFNNDEPIQDQVTVDPLNDVNNTLLGSNVLLTRPEDSALGQPSQQRIWHRYFMQTEGQTIQIKIFLNDEQMRDKQISQSDFQIDGIILYITEQGRIIG